MFIVLTQYYYPIVFSCHAPTVESLLVTGVQQTEASSPRNILIQGVTGAGKSTLCHTFAYLWATDCARIQKLGSFDLVILVKANLLTSSDKSIYDYMHRELLPDIDNICDAINDLKLLIIVDGYDEIIGNNKIVVDLLAKHVCPRSTVILTTREGQTPSTKFFSHGFCIASFTSSDVQSFLSKLPRSTEATPTQLDLDSHHLGAVLSTPLFLWFYYLLGDEVFDDVDVSSRTSLFTRIVDGISCVACDRLQKTKAECKEALNILEEQAYICLCSNKFYFKENMGKLSASLGLVKKSESLLRMKQRNTYMFSHKSLAEYLTARYLAKQTGNRFNLLLSKIPEIPDANRRQSSLIGYFLCGFLNTDEQLVAVCKTFLPEVESVDTHGQHLALQYCAELDKPELLSHVMGYHVNEEIRCEKECNQYCFLGIKRLHK